MENITNLRTFPTLPNTVVIFGMGNASVNLRSMECLRHNDVIYWGDLDVFGLRILSQFRQAVNDARSLFMDIEAWQSFRHLMHAPAKDYQRQSMRERLRAGERQAFQFCNDKTLQLEQEWIPQEAVKAGCRKLSDRASG